MSSIKDEYEKLHIIGKGSYATIWKARHRELGYVRALKMSNQMVEDESDPAYQSFLNECKVLLKIGNGAHPNIVHIYKPRLIENRAVVEMDYIDGETLCEYLQRKHFMPIGEVYKFINDIVGALAYCHYDIYRYLMNPNEDDLKSDPNDGHKYIIDEATEQRLVKKYAVTHNDLHSNNVMRRNYDGSYMLLDFGLAITNGKAVKSSGRRGGALEYMSPEKFNKSSIISTQSDIYSLGVLLFEVLAGRVPFVLDKQSFEEQPEIASYNMMLFHTQGIPPEIEPLRREAFEKAFPGQTYVKDYPPELEAIIRRCLEKDPAKRYPNAKVLLEDIKKNIPANVSNDATQKQLEQATRTISELNQNLKIQKEKAEQLQNDKTTLASTIVTLREDNNKLKSENKTLVDDNSKLKTDLEQRQTTTDTATVEENQRLKEENNQLESQIIILKQDYEQSTTEVVALKQSLSEQEKNKKIEKDEHSQLQKNLTALQKENDTLKADNKKLSTDNSALKKKNDELKAGGKPTSKLPTVLAVLFLVTTAIAGFLWMQKNGQVNVLQDDITAKEDSIVQLNNHIDTLLSHSEDGKNVVLKVKDGVWTGETTKDGIMNGIGQLRYSSNDNEGRVLFVGKMIDGKRNDKGLLLYKNGVYFDGEFANDNFKEGVYKVPSDDMYYKGTFKDNAPFNGKWCNIKSNKVIYNITNGKIK